MLGQTEADTGGGRESTGLSYGWFSFSYRVSVLQQIIWVGQRREKEALQSQKVSGPLPEHSKYRIQPAQSQDEISGG